MNAATAKCPCNHCSGHIEFDSEHTGETVQCPHCGIDTLLFLPQLARVPFKPPAPPPLITTIAAERAYDVDQVFFSNGQILVSKTRFMAFGETFAMAGITSVRMNRNPPSVAGPVCLGIIGLCSCAASLWVGIPLVVGAIVWGVLLKPTFAAIITTASGETRTPCQSKSEALIYTVVESLNQAIIARG
jgi:hypothetical protein